MNDQIEDQWNAAYRSQTYFPAELTGSRKDVVKQLEEIAALRDINYAIEAETDQIFVYNVHKNGRCLIATYMP
jgi:hypothetical protein